MTNEINENLNVNSEENEDIIQLNLNQLPFEKKTQLSRTILKRFSHRHQSSSPIRVEKSTDNCSKKFSKFINMFSKKKCSNSPDFDKDISINSQDKKLEKIEVIALNSEDGNKCDKNTNIQMENILKPMSSQPNFNENITPSTFSNNHSSYPHVKSYPSPSINKSESLGARVNPISFQEEEHNISEQLKSIQIQESNLFSITVHENDMNGESNSPGKKKFSKLCTVHTQVDYVHYLVPDLLKITNCNYYWGVMDRYEAERLLDNKPEGTFLLRDSAQEEFLFSVSFRRYSRSLHARVEQWDHKFSFDSHDTSVFASNSVCGLIEHYKDPACCMFFEPMLTIPLCRTIPFSLQHLCRANICNKITYDSITCLDLPKSLVQYLQYYHYKQKVRVRRF